jgi:putative transposase
MGNTYSQLYVQAIFAVQYRLALLDESWEQQLQKYITGIVQNQGHKMLAINNVEDHMHIFFGWNPKQSISQLMQFVKGDSSGWINENNFTKRHFRWQEGYGAFSYAKSEIGNVARYIENQKEHHKTENMQDEFHRILREFGVEFDERYTFKAPID